MKTIDLLIAKRKHLVEELKVLREQTSRIDCIDRLERAILHIRQTDKQVSLLSELIYIAEREGTPFFEKKVKSIEMLTGFAEKRQY